MYKFLTVRRDVSVVVPISLIILSSRKCFAFLLCRKTNLSTHVFRFLEKPVFMTVVCSVYYQFYSMYP